MRKLKWYSRQSNGKGGMSLDYYLISMKHIVEMLMTLKLFKKIANWEMLLMDYVGLLKEGSGIIELKNGIKLSIHWGTTDKWSIHEIVLRDDYRIKEIAHECEVVVDLGANTGVFSIVVASLNNRLKVYAFEPEPENYRRLVDNIKLTGLSSRVLTFREAVACKGGSKRLYLSSDNRTHSLVRRGAGKFTTVRTQTLEDIFRRNTIETCDFLKIDVEGAEYEILYSLDPAILGKIKYISMEYHNVNKEEGQDGKSLKKYLEGHGFSVTQRESLQRRVGSLFAVHPKAQL